MTTDDAGYLHADLTLRPPRVAMLVRSDERWRDWAMFALEVANDYWGGAGFILVPFDPATQEADEKLAPAVRAYDPDHVVTLMPPAERWEQWYPGSLNLPADVQERDEMCAVLGPVGDQLATKAREQVASWCSPLRAARTNRGSRSEHETCRSLALGYSTSAPRLQLAPSASRGDGDGPLVAADPSWRTEAGLLAALRAGVAPGYLPRAEPGADSFRWLVSGDGAPPSGLVVDEPGEGAARFWSEAGQLISRVGQGHIDSFAVVVAGDAPADFALALAYERLLNGVVWLPTAFLPGSGPGSRHAAWWSALKAKSEMDGRFIDVTSTSLALSDQREIVRRLDDSAVIRGARFSGDDDDDVDVIRFRDSALSPGQWHYVIDGSVSMPAAIPVHASQDGSREALTHLAAPVPVPLMLPESSPNVPYWYVDVRVAGNESPHGKDVPSGALTVAMGSMPEVNIRASRAGYSFDPRTMGWSPAGAILPSRLGRPTLRVPSVTMWTRTKAGVAGLDVRPSEPGRRVELLASRAGGRDALLSMLSPDVFRIMRQFTPRERTPSSRERKDDQARGAVVLGVAPYLTFAGLRNVVGEDNKGLRESIDAMLATGLLRRGLVLDCVNCQHPSFVPVEQLGQLYRCGQCGAENTLISPRWREPTDEPTWFYDLYVPARDWVGGNGDVVAQAARYLRSRSTTYADASEVEFFARGSNKAVAEIDLIASVDGQVVVVEAKANGSYGTQPERRRQIAKVIRVARLLGADRICLATSEPSWSAGDVEHLRSEASRVRPFAPDVEVLTDLGAA